MSEQFNSDIAKADLMRWRTRLFEVHDKLSEIYTEMTERMKEMEE